MTHMLCRKLLWYFLERILWAGTQTGSVKGQPTRPSLVLFSPIFLWFVLRLPSRCEAWEGFFGLQEFPWLWHPQLSWTRTECCKHNSTKYSCHSSVFCPRVFHGVKQLLTCGTGPWKYAGEPHEGFWGSMLKWDPRGISCSLTNVVWPLSV